ncbi:MAG: NUDIX domain-containing protein [Burkholderiaceae bacterium]
MTHDRADAPTRSAPVPLPAATIMLLRDGPDGLEVFMVVRHHQIDFASGALVFPGGKVDPQDRDPRVQARLGTHASGDANETLFRVAAIREAFEESGTLLASHSDGRPLSGASGSVELARWRDGLNDQSLTLGEVLDEADLQLAPDTLVPFSHWVTPTFMPKRFDTRFYVARFPEAQEAGHDGRESVDSVWIRPSQVVADAQAGRRTVVFATLSNVVRLAQFGSVDEALKTCAATPLVRIEPWLEEREDGRYVCIPKDAGFTLNEHRAAGR